MFAVRVAFGASRFAPGKTVHRTVFLRRLARAPLRPLATGTGEKWADVACGEAGIASAWRTDLNSGCQSP